MRFDFGLLMTFAGSWAVCIGIFFSSQGDLSALHVNYVVALMMVYCLAAFSVRLDGRKSGLVKTFHIIGLFLSSTLAFVLAYDTTWLINSVNFISTNSVLV